MVMVGMVVIITTCEGALVAALGTIVPGESEATIEFTVQIVILIVLGVLIH